MIKKYKINYDFKTEVEVEIDHDIMTDEKLEEINNFWSGAEYRKRESGSALYAVLKMLTRICLLIKIDKGYNTEDIVEEFDYTKTNGIEGWPKMDGSMGIKICHVDNFDFEYEDMTITG